MTLAQNISDLRKSIPAHVKLIVVSKTQSIAAISEAYHAGEKCFGENKVQELTSKKPFLPNDIEWHFLGHLQSNKVKYIAPFISMIHSIDSLKLLQEINKEAVKNNRIIDCLLELYIATEETKFGLSFNESETLLNSPEYLNMQNIRIRGLMGMASFTDDNEKISNEFSSLRMHFQHLKQKYFLDKPYFDQLSMGMSGDYLIAIENGSTMVRIGTSIFGERKYF